MAAQAQQSAEANMPHSGHGGHGGSGLEAGALSSRNKESPAPTAFIPGESISLTSRQAEVLHWIAEGRTNGEIGSILGCSVETVKNHVKQIFQRLGVHSRTAAASYAYRQLIASHAPQVLEHRPSLFRNTAAR